LKNLLGITDLSRFELFKDFSQCSLISGKSPFNRNFVRNIGYMKERLQKEVRAKLYQENQDGYYYASERAYAVELGVEKRFKGKNGVVSWFRVDARQGILGKEVPIDCGFVMLACPGSN